MFIPHSVNPNRCSRPKLSLWWPSILLIVLCSLLKPFAASAFPLTTFDTVLEALMLAQEADAQILPRAFGIDSTPIAFTSSITPDGGAFSYATVPGSMYVGVPFSLTAGGSYDPLTHMGAWSSSALLGSTTWAGSGDFAPDANDPNAQSVSFEATSALFLAFFDYAKVDVAVTIDGVTVSAGANVYTVGGVPIASSIDLDAILPAAPPSQNRDWNTRQIALNAPGFSGFTLLANGTVDPSGAGNFVVTVVPEPSMLALMFLGLAAVFVGRRRAIGV